MSDEGDCDGGKIGAFLLGFLVGVLVCLGGGGTLFVVQQRRAAMEARHMMLEAEAARAMAEEARQQAEAERDRARKAIEAEKKAKE
jgi:hypothetical protein